MLSHNTLRKRFHALCARIQAPKTVSTYRTVGTGFGDPHVEIDTRSYHYVVTERGQEFKRKTTTDADELLFWLLSDVVFGMASSHELKHRVPNQDSRRIIFQQEILLLSRLNKTWAARKNEELAAILAEHPYSDD